MLFVFFLKKLIFERGGGVGCWKGFGRSIHLVGFQQQPEVIIILLSMVRSPACTQLRQPSAAEALFGPTSRILATLEACKSPTLRLERRVAAFMLKEVTMTQILSTCDCRRALPVGAEAPFTSLSEMKPHLKTSLSPIARRSQWLAGGAKLDFSGTAVDGVEQSGVWCWRVFVVGLAEISCVVTTPVSSHTCRLALRLNRAERLGGGFALQGQSTATFEDAVFVGNTALYGEGFHL